MGLKPCMKYMRKEKNMKYKIIQGDTPEQLEDKVNRSIEVDNFEPLGGVCGYENIHGRLLQAMIKEKEC